MFNIFIEYMFPTVSQRGRSTQESFYDFDLSVNVERYNTTINGVPIALEQGKARDMWDVLVNLDKLILGLFSNCTHYLYIHLLEWIR